MSKVIRTQTHTEVRSRAANNTRSLAEGRILGAVGRRVHVVSDHHVVAAGPLDDGRAHGAADQLVELQRVGRGGGRREAGDGGLDGAAGVAGGEAAGGGDGALVDVGLLAEVGGLLLHVR